MQCTQRTEGLNFSAFHLIIIDAAEGNQNKHTTTTLAFVICPSM